MSTFHNASCLENLYASQCMEWSKRSAPIEILCYSQVYSNIIRISRLNKNIVSITDCGIYKVNFWAWNSPKLTLFDCSLFCSKAFLAFETVETRYASIDCLGHFQLLKLETSTRCFRAFSTVGTVETMYALTHSLPVETLSVQEVLDCSLGYYGLFGCSGGDTCTALEWMIRVPINIGFFLHC